MDQLIFIENSSLSKRFELIKLHYEFLTPKIFIASEKYKSRWVNPYCDINWSALFTPIEQQAWMALRWFGHTPMYPQYPVGRFYLDFGNPVLKVGIECDGKEYHMDKEKDLKRDLELFDIGWKIYRISGSDCLKPVENDYWNIGDFYYEYEKKEILSRFYEETIEGLVTAIGIYHFGYKTYYREPDERGIAIECLRNRISLPDKIFHR